jgi:hypothetical protein
MASAARPVRASSSERSLLDDGEEVGLGRLGRAVSEVAGDGDPCLGVFLLEAQGDVGAARVMQLEGEAQLLQRADVVLRDEAGAARRAAPQAVRQRRGAAAHLHRALLRGELALVVVGRRALLELVPGDA